MQHVERSLHARRDEAWRLLRCNIGNPPGGIAADAYVNNYVAIDDMLRYARIVLRYLTRVRAVERRGQGFIDTRHYRVNARHRKGRE